MIGTRSSGRYLVDAVIFAAVIATHFLAGLDRLRAARQVETAGDFAIPARRTTRGSRSC